MRSTAGGGEDIAIGMIGLGRWGTWAASRLSTIGGRVVATCELTSSRPPRTDHSLGPGRVPMAILNDHRRLLDRRDVDAVVIAAPVPQRFPMLIQAIEAGKHVYLQTPLAETLDKALFAEQAMRRSRCVVQVGMPHRSAPPWRRARDVVRGGRLGQLEWIHISLCRIESPRIASACHQRLDIVRWMTGQSRCESVVASGELCPLDGSGAGEPIHAVFDFGTFETILDIGGMHAPDGPTVAFHGDAATLLCGQDFRLTSRTGPHAGVLSRWPDDDDGTAHLRDWLDCVRTGRTPSATVQAAIDVMTDVDAANAAAQAGRRMAWDEARGQVSETDTA
ncbi:MAG: Gfo/Idh/MocA family oxidoreductase [Phycisphaerae bacterium]|nr:Gfo/Idh/MocA family oxidoreductase [Phycisphaerae bacterium]